MPRKEIELLASLLDDPDESAAVSVLEKLLEREDELDDLPGILQESSDPLLRRRVHQLQVALTMRRRRRNYLSRITDPQISLPEKLAEIHLLWFDNDSLPQLIEEQEELRRRFKKQPVSLKEVSRFMQQEKYLPVSDAKSQAENYCIGAVLNEHAGAHALLILLILIITGREDFEIYGNLNEFALAEGSSAILFQEGWAIRERSAIPGDMVLWSVDELLRFVGIRLLSCSVRSDSFRYVYTIAQSITGRDGKEIMEYFPYPFSPEKKKEN